MSSFLHGLGLLLLPLCGWLAGDAVQAQTSLHLAALQGTIALLQRIRQEILVREGVHSEPYGTRAYNQPRG